MTAVGVLDLGGRAEKPRQEGESVGIDGSLSSRGSASGEDTSRASAADSDIFPGEEEATLPAQGESFQWPRDSAVVAGTAQGLGGVAMATRAEERQEQQEQQHQQQQQQQLRDYQETDFKRIKQFREDFPEVPSCCSSDSYDGDTDDRG